MEAINWLAVAVAALTTFVIGGPWYSPALFLKPWQRAMRITDQDAGHPARVFGLAYIFSFISAATLALFIGANADWARGLHMGLLIGAGFVTASFGVNYQFAGRGFAAIVIDGGFHILQFGAMGAIIGAWPR